MNQLTTIIFEIAKTAMHKMLDFTEVFQNQV